MTAQPDRRTTLADAAIATLAADGGRGLTHRAVDRAAGVAQGSTSFYFRTREALLEAAVRRLAELDGQDVPPLEVETPEQMADVVTTVLEEWLGVGVDRLIARYELALEARRRPALLSALQDAGTALREVLAAALTRLGGPEPDVRALDLAAALDGLLLDQVAGAGPRRSRPELRAAVGRLVDATLAP